jgi:hypothetical protein
LISAQCTYQDITALQFFFDTLFTLFKCREKHIISCFHNIIADHNILTSVRIDPVIVGTSLIVQDPDTIYYNMTASCHVERPECSIAECDPTDRQIFHIFKIRCSRTVCHNNILRTFTKSTIGSVILEHFVTLTVNRTFSQNTDVVLMQRTQKAAAFPTGRFAWIFKFAASKKVQNIFFAQTADQLCPPLSRYSVTLLFNTIVPLKN